jgi:hypothetical protein
MASQGCPTAAIAKVLSVRYQVVRQVLVKDAARKATP